MLIPKVLIDTKEYDRLVKWWLEKQYQKAKEYMLMGNLWAVQFKKRQPYKSEKWYFRLNQQYRAFGYIVGDEFRIFHIDDHSD
jgi:plasmid maintenance system killer protein